MFCSNERCMRDISKTMTLRIIRRGEKNFVFVHLLRHSTKQELINLKINFCHKINQNGNDNKRRKKNKNQTM